MFLVNAQYAMQNNMYTSSQILTAYEKQYADLGAAIAALRPPSFIPAEQPQEVEAIPAPTPTPTPAPKPAPKPKRDLAKLTLPFGTTLRIGVDEAWDLVYIEEGFQYGETTFATPYAVSLAHSKRITEKHPKETKPGDAWFHIKVITGKYAGKRLCQVYDDLNK